MRAGDIIFVRGNGLLSNLIRFFDSGEFSHVAIAVSDTEVFEAQYYMKAKIVPMHYEDYEVVSLNLTDEEIEKLKVLCGVMQGKWYDYTQVLGYIFRQFFNSDIKRFNNPNNLICSEAIGIVLFILGRSANPLVDSTPNELYNLVKTK